VSYLLYLVRENDDDGWWHQFDSDVKGKDLEGQDEQPMSTPEVHTGESG
jgi:hypothetical protein